MVRKVVKLSDLLVLYKNNKVVIMDYDDKILNFDINNVINNKCGLLSFEDFLATIKYKGCGYHNEMVIDHYLEDDFVVIKLDKFRAYPIY